MQEPSENMKVDINWGVLILCLPFMWLIPDMWGAFFGVAAVIILIAVAVGAIALRSPHQTASGPDSSERVAAKDAPSRRSEASVVAAVRPARALEDYSRDFDWQ